MEPKVNYTVVGLFVIVLLAAITISVIWLSAGFDHKEYVLYRIFLNESVTGLSIDAPVKYNGVEVGVVKDLQLNPINPQQVEVLLSIQADAPITKSTVATLSTQGLTGVGYIDLTNKGTDTTPLTAGPGQSVPIIKTRPSLFVRLDTSINELTTNFNRLSDNLNAVLNTQNQQAIQQTLSNLQQISANLANNSARINQLLENANKASQGLPGLVQAGQTTLITLQNQTLPATTQILSNLQTITNNLVVTSRELQQNPAIIIRGRSVGPLGPGENTHAP